MDLLIELTDERQKAAAQRAMEVKVAASLDNIGPRNIGFPSGNRDETIYTNGKGGLWCAFGDASDAAIPRRWNVFGVYDDRSSRSQTITVEINIPMGGDSARVAGFFARDPLTGAVYLMHDGGIGGGKPGVGRSQFLAWTRPELFLVERKEKPPREAMLIGRVDAPDLPSRLWRFVQTVRSFKDAVAEGSIPAAQMKRLVAQLERYRRESSGRRRGRRPSEIDYISYHGDIVDALQKARNARKARGEIVVNTKLIDLYVTLGGTRTEIYEVKTSTDRQTIYTALGQLVTHAGSLDPAVRRILVLPEGEIAGDLKNCMKTLGVDLQRYRLEGRRNKTVRFL